MTKDSKKINLADGITLQFHGEEFKDVVAEWPDELQFRMPVSSRTILNGTIPEINQLERLRGYFGQNFTLADVAVWYKKNRFEFSKTTDYNEIESLVAVAKEQEGKAKKGAVTGVVSNLTPAESRAMSTFKEALGQLPGLRPNGKGAIKAAFDWAVTRYPDEYEHTEYGTFAKHIQHARKKQRSVLGDTADARSRGSNSHSSMGELAQMNHAFENTED